MQRAASEQLINNINFNFTWFMCDCDEALAAGYTNKLFLNLSVDVIIGPPCVTAALMTGYISSFYNFPIFVWGASVTSKFNPIPTVTNINTNTVMLSMGVQAVLSQFQWQEISLVYIPDNIGRVCSYFKQDFESLLNNNPNITIVYTKQMDSTSTSMKDSLRKVQTCSRIIVSCFDSAVDRRNFLLAMNDLGLVESSEYVLIVAQLKNQGMLQEINSSGANGVQYDGIWKQSDRSNDGRDADALKAARRSIVIDLENQSVDQINTFNKKMYAQFGQPPFNCNGSCMGGADEQNPSPYARSLHDTTYAYLRALNLTMLKYGYMSSDLARNGTQINNMSKGEFDGNNLSYEIRGSIVLASLSLTKKYTDEANIWANRGGKRPLYKPLCGYTGLECPQNMTTYILIGGGLILLLFIATVSGISYAIREKLKEKERLTRECLIPFGELRNLKELKSNEDMRSLEANKSLKSLQSSQSGSTKLTSMDDKKLETENYVHFLYNREVVFAIKYQVRVRIFNEDFANLKKDLIAKERYVGDSFVMFTLMRDIASGLIALHGSFAGAHGMLSSENCLINDRWQVKISDFGLNMIRESQPMSKRKLLWTAPELLRENNRKGTKEGDVYSFAIICCELVNRETVWNGVEREDDVDEILYRLRRSNVAIPHRPQLHPREEINQNLLHLVRDCWGEIPTERPKIDMVRTMLKQMVRDGNQNLMDYVVNLLNGLYTAFDGIIDSHDAYKVETIGDGYLVCSGIPRRNGNDHAKAIAELSFSFLRTVSTFRIDHLPNERVNLRIGIHTGPAVAGVVGLTMPRYCLFGDTVNTASRMESNGRPGRIHISTTTNHYLTNIIGGYVTEPRGEVIIKGKGVMETFWLLGHSGDSHYFSGSSVANADRDTPEPV
uniref:Guanylate cyclase n=1 Tax=Meloidogyne javanica TaxID=6303 RepID=A0A915LQJ7_MELJA